MRLPAMALLVLVGCGAPPVKPTVDGGNDAGPSPDGGPITTAVGAWEWVPVEGSQCASGSTAGIGVNRGTNDEELFVFMQGGGACWNQGTCVPSLLSFGPLCDYGTLCLLDLAGGQRPTALYVTHPDPFPRDGGGAFPTELAQVSSSLALDRSRAGNPFKDATYVFVPYCTGDLHAGASERTYRYKYQLFDPEQTYVVRHAGAANIDRYLERLKATLPRLKRIWLTGVSGGGYGATLNFERVQRAFPQAEVHLLADSAPLIATPRFDEWRSTWNLQLPGGCCDGGFPEVVSWLATTFPTRRLALLSKDRDRVIAWFFLAPPGAANGLNPPLDAFNAALVSLEGRYDATANAKYFVVPGEEHVLWAGYGVRLADGGASNPVSSRDGGTSLRAWIDAWARGDAGWSSTR